MLKLLTILIIRSIYLKFVSSLLQNNNVCNKLHDYYVRDICRDCCWYDPDVNATAYGLALNHGYKLEVYKTVTEDGYILTIFRLPPKNNTCKGTVFLQHPSLSSASIWMDLGNESLAFLLVNEGYDVWMGNLRGTEYSTEHVYISPDDNHFWNFSFHEMGLYDIPAQLEVVKKETRCKCKIIYVGHSIGTTVAYVYSSLLPANASTNIGTFISWSPIAYVKHPKGLTRILAPFADLILDFGTLTGQLSGITINSTLHHFIELFCFNVNARLCLQAIELLGGPSQHFSPARFPVLIYQNFAGFALKATVHLIQIYRDGGRFKYFNYGILGNKKHYGSAVPPEYPVANINVSMVFMYGGNDYLSVERDVFYFYNKLRPKYRGGIYKIPLYNHVDFHYAKDVKSMVFDKTIDIIRNYFNLCTS